MELAEQPADGEPGAGHAVLPRLLYPEQYDNDLYKTVAGYFKTFYGYDLSESEFNEIAANAQPKA